MSSYDKIVISLTTIDSRLELLKKVILNLFRQTLKPNVIHIFYSNDPLFYDNGISDMIMANFVKEIDMVNYFNIEIIQTPTKNIGSYRKLIPALKIYKNDIIITIDDDHEFEPSFIQKFMDQYNLNNCTVCSGGKFFDMQNYHNNIDYTDVFNTNIFNTKDVPISVMNFIPHGFGGILYHTNMFDSDFVDFDYDNMSELVKKNDDVFIRNYTFNKNTKVILMYIKKNHLLDIENQDSLYYNYNIHTKTENILDEINKFNFNKCDDIINIDDEILYFQINHNIHQSNRADVKLLQYEEYSHVQDLNNINLTQIIGTHLFKKTVNSNCIVINIEKDLKRYYSALDEIKKLSFNGFVHLKATYWKETDNFIKDLNYITGFLKKFNSNIDNNEITINKFSEISDKNIFIQDGPLACYCSHIRSMMYGYLNFKDYTIICEDDIFIGNTALIEEYIKCVPDDWDIICFNSKSLNSKHTEPLYKFDSTFCSLHFYIINNKCFETIFQNVYPITDQIDILIGNMFNKLNIYNIIDTVYQKNFSTNTQNNLNIIMNTVGYESVRETLHKIKIKLVTYINNVLPFNSSNVNNRLASCIISDVIYNYVLHNDNDNINSDVECYLDNIKNENVKYLDLYDPLYLFIKCCVKGINTRNVTFALMDDIRFILDCFVLHNTYSTKYDDIVKAYNYGSSANVYLMENKNRIIKAFNKKLRWTCEQHDNYLDIFNKEILILKKVFGNCVDYDETNLTITMPYYGVSLYDNFLLPENDYNWKEQIKNIFLMLTTNNICYTEFNLKNIVVLNNKITFIDFGLASILESVDNSLNCNNFIELLELLNNQFTNIENLEKRQIQYKIFMNNIRNEKDSKYKNNIY
jgi:hypothetical protein